MRELTDVRERPQDVLCLFHPRRASEAVIPDTHDTASPLFTAGMAYGVLSPEALQGYFHEADEDSVVSSEEERGADPPISDWESVIAHHLGAGAAHRGTRSEARLALHLRSIWSRHCATRA